MLKERIYAERHFGDEQLYSVFIDFSRRAGRLQTGIAFVTPTLGKHIKCNVTESTSLDEIMTEFERLCERMTADKCVLVRSEKGGWL